MSDDRAGSKDASQEIPRGGRLFLLLWTVGLLALVVLSGVLCTRSLARYKATTQQMRDAWRMVPSAGSTATPGGAAPVDVHVGLSLDRVSEIDLKEALWTADFHVWFRWSGEGVNPGEHFELANGKILEREKVVSIARGAERFEKYRVVARMVKPFDTTRAPVNDESLTIQLRDALDGAEKLRYVAEDVTVERGPSALPMGFSIVSVAPAVLRLTTGSGPSDPAQLGSAQATRSVLVVAMVTSKPGVSRYIRIFQALFASVAICLIVFFIKPVHVDPRFGLPVGAFFAAVGNNISIAASMPESGQVTLVQMVNAIGLATIFLTLVQSAVSLYLFDSLGRERYSVVFDRISFVLLGGGYLVLNLLLPIAAR